MEATKTAQDLRFPIGKFRGKGELSATERAELISQIAETPARLRDAVKGLTSEQLDTPYRPEGWTVRQVVHHLPDSHLNSYVRFKLALTEEQPTIKTYDQEAWAKHLDYARRKPSHALESFRRIRAENYELLKELPESAFERTGQHTERGALTLKQLVQLIAEHAESHAAQLRTRRAEYKAFKTAASGSS